MTATEEHPGGPMAASIEKLRQELDRLMEAVVSQGGRALDAFGLRSGRWQPAIDVIETSDEILVDADLPGLDAQSIDITIAGNMLTLKGSKPAATAVEGQTAHLKERLRGEFQRSIPMPAPVDPDAVSAELKQGVLQIRLGKAERARAKHIPVAAPTHAPHPEL